MLAKKFLLLLETLLSRAADGKLPTVTSTRAAFPDPRHPVTPAATPCVEQNYPRSVILTGGSILSQDHTLWDDPNDLLVLKPGKRATYRFQRETEKIGNVLTPHRQGQN